MISPIAFIERNENTIRNVFFILFLLAGIVVVKDYGLGWDDDYSRADTGLINVNFILHHAKDALLQGNEKYHGPFIEIVLVFIEKALRLQDLHSIYLMRHFVLFGIFFLAMMMFYQLARKVFSAPYAFLSLTLIILTPRIFAESFYNSKDLILLSFFVFAVSSYINFFEKKNTLSAIMHGICTGMLIAIRIVGVLIPVLTIAYAILFMILYKEWKRYASLLLVYLVFSVGITIACWPVLWLGPAHHFVQAFAEMKKYHWDATVLYFGKQIKATELPWHYLPVWIAITTPLLVTFALLTGLLAYIVSLFRNSWIRFLENYYWNGIVFLSLAPILSIIVLHSVVYDGWRHVYFVYPLLVMLGVYGIRSLMTILPSWAQFGMGIICCIQIISLSVWIFVNHPYEQVYFNPLAQKRIPHIEQQFELDYWGLSYKQELEYLARTDHQQTISIAFQNPPGELNVSALPITLRQRFAVRNEHDTTAQYFMTNYRWTGPPGNRNLLHQIQVDGIPILGLYGPATP